MSDMLLQRNIIKIYAFHDERMIHGWLYHGYILCEESQLELLVNKLSSVKIKSDCDSHKRIHFSDLRSSSKGSSKTMTALEWVKLFRYELIPIMWFYFFGINMNNIDYEKFGSGGLKRNDSIYNRFFEIGLFSACGFFFDFNNVDVAIQSIYSEKRDINEKNRFLELPPYKINQKDTNVFVIDKNITMIDGNPTRETHNRKYCNVINFVDVLTGAFSQVLDYTSKSRGCNEVAERVYSICERITTSPYNKNSRYYKRYAVSFFPKKKKTVSAITENGIELHEDLFYTKRSIRMNQSIIPGLESYF